MTAAREPRSTYRLQIRAGSALADAAGLVDYLAELGCMLNVRVQYVEKRDLPTLG